MAEIIKPNQNVSPSQPAAKAPVGTPGAGGSLPKGAASFLDGKTGLVLGLIFVIAVIGLLFLIARSSQKKPPPSEQPAVEPLTLSSPIPGATPPQLPKVQAEDKKTALREFFKKASPANFREKFVEQVPAAAADSFVNFSKATNSEEKKSAARGFYIMLNDPGADRSDPAFGPFIGDVRVELEKEIGGPLFQ